MLNALFHWDSTHGVGHSENVLSFAFFTLESERDQLSNLGSTSFGGSYHSREGGRERDSERRSFAVQREAREYCRR